MSGVTTRMVVALCLLAAGVCRGQTGESGGGGAAAAAEAAYARLTKADEAREAHEWTVAPGLYRDALAAYTELRRAYPEWQPAVIGFRITYCRNQIDKVLQLAASAGQAAEPVETSEPAAPPIRRAGAVRDTMAAEVKKISTTAAGCLKAGKTAEARRMLMDGLRLDPDALGVRLLLGVAQCQAGDYGDASYVLAPLVDEYPGYAAARLALAAALLGQGKTDEAIVQTRKAIEISPNVAEAHLDMARLLLLTKPADPVSAKAAYEKAVALGAARDADLETRLNPSPPAPAAAAAAEEAANPSPTSAVPVQSNQ